MYEKLKYVFLNHRHTQNKIQVMEVQGSDQVRNNQRHGNQGQPQRRSSPREGGVVTIAPVDDPDLSNV